MLDMDVVYNDYAQTVFKFLMTLCHDDHTSEELTQETFYQAVRCAEKFDGTCKVSTWLCQIAKHLWYQELDKRKRRDPSELTDSIVSEEASPENKACLKAEKMELFRKVHVLSETEKEIVLLRLTGAFSFREIGDILKKARTGRG